MKSVVVYGSRDYKIQDSPYPKREKGEVIIKVAYSLMCSSDVKFIDGNYHGLQLPMIPGHEFSGIIVDADDMNLIGKKVVSDNLMPCGECEFCKADKGNLCENLNETGSNVDGSFAEYLKVKEKNIFVLPDKVDLFTASIIEPLAVALNAANRVPMEGNESISIFGAGCIGLLIVSIFKYRGFKNIRVFDYIENRLRVAKKIGASKIINLTNRDNIEFLETLEKNDVVYDATGVSDCFNFILSVVKPGGKIGYVGYTGTQTVMFEPSKIMLKELNIYGVLSPFKTYEEAIDYLGNGAIKTNELITHVVQLEDFGEIYKKMKFREDNIIRAAFDFNKTCCDK